MVLYFSASYTQYSQTHAEHTVKKKVINSFLYFVIHGCFPFTLLNCIDHSSENNCC